MPLTLVCLCGDTSGSICQLTRLVLRYTGSFQHIGVNCGTPRFLLSSASAPYSLEYLYEADVIGTKNQDLPLTLVNNWGDLIPLISIDSSLFQMPADGGCLYSANFDIEQIYTCTDATGSKTWSIFSYNAAGSLGRCVDGNGVVRSVAKMGTGGGYAHIYASTPLGLCNGSSSTGGVFDPAPKSYIIKTNAVNKCLCASGGVAPYSYAIVKGNLPSGQSLNPTTGCIEGVPDGVSPGTTSITFQVVDGAGSVAEVTCGFVPDFCPVCAGNTFY